MLGGGNIVKPIAQEIIKELVDELYGRPLMSNLTRPIFLEKLLTRLLKGAWRHVGGDWSGWDLENLTSRARIELKQSAARQTWTDGPTRLGKPTKPVFDIAERTGYFGDGGSAWINTPGRPADLYVFAWHPGFIPKEEVDHRDPEQWEFYLLPEARLPKGQKTIGLNTLKKLDPVFATHDDIANKVVALLASEVTLKASIIQKADPEPT
jgi:hypothetical protein